MSEYTIYESAVKQCNSPQDQLAKARAGLRELKIEATAQSLHEENGNAARAAFARFEGRIEQLLAILGLALVLVIGISGGAAYAAPDPVTPPGVSKISGPNLFRENGADLLAYLYAANTPATVSSADCHAAITVRICPAQFVRVSGWDNWRKSADGGSVILDGLPAGIQEFAVVSRNGSQIGGQAPWTMDVDTGRSLSGSVEGIACGPNAVALSGISAENIDGGTFGYLVVLFIFCCVGCVVTVWARERIKGRLR
jgi:hypothetical protein